MSTSMSEAEQRERGAEPVGTINVFDPHPLNWLFITWNTMEEPIRADQEGYIVMALASRPPGATTRRSRSRCAPACASRTASRARPTRSSTTSTRSSSGRRRIRRARTSTSPRRRLRGGGRPTCVFQLPEPDGLTWASSAASTSPAPVLAQPRLRLQEDGQRRRPLVSDRRTGPVGHRTVHARRGLLVDRHRDGDPAGPSRVRRHQPDHG